VDIRSVDKTAIFKTNTIADIPPIVICFTYTYLHDKSSADKLHCVSDVTNVRLSVLWTNWNRELVLSAHIIGNIKRP
jgi:hypothetical protein